MAVSGCNAKIVVKESGPGDPEILISDMNSWSINYSFQATEFRPIGAYYPVRGISAADWSLSIAGYFNQNDPGQSEINAGKEYYFEIFPTGVNVPASDPIMRGICFVSGLDTSGSPDDLIPLSISATGSSELEAINTFIGNE